MEQPANQALAANQPNYSNFGCNVSNELVALITQQNTHFLILHESHEETSIKIFKRESSNALSLQ